MKKKHPTQEPRMPTPNYVKNTNSPAYPYYGDITDTKGYAGMTKIEFFSSECLKSILSNPSYCDFSPASNVKSAVYYAKELMALLQEEP